MEDVNELLFSQLKERPEILYEINPAVFEQLVAEILSSFGYEVQLTKKTKDGWADIIAIGHQPASKIIIECKRYKKDHAVGLDIIQRLYGLAEQEQATKGILVTTSSFTKPAMDFIREHEWRLEGIDFNKFQEWIDRYILAQDINSTKSLPLYFDLSEFSTEEIRLILDQLSSLYASCGGDRLIIDDAAILDSAEIYEPVGG